MKLFQPVILLLQLKRPSFFKGNLFNLNTTRITVLLVFVFTTHTFAQEDAWVYFLDKPNAQSYLDNPLSMLTQRALDRRANQNIALDSKDVPLHQPYVDQITAATGITVMAKSKWLNCLHIRGSLTDINALSNFSFVQTIVFANKNLNSSGKNSVPTLLPQPVNKQMDVQTDFSYGNSANQIQMLNGQVLHQANYTGLGKIIAVLDSGFTGVDTATPFQRLFTNNLILGGYNYVAGNTTIYSTHNHGTMTLSCMGGFASGQLIGTAPDAQYYLYITEDVSAENPVEESYWVAAAEEADRLGVDIISTSLGYFEYDNANYSHDYSDMTGNKAFASKGANIAFSRGMIVVASAGNSGSGAEPHIGVPAEATNVLAIGAVQPNENYASFSSIGPSFDGRVKPDVMAQGQQSVVSNTTGGIITANGTSFSCPIMAGMIASFWQAVPWATNAQVLNFVKQSADRFANPDAQYGYGIPDFQQALAIAALAVNENVKKSFLIYPNPFDDIVSIGYEETITNPNLVLYNSLGQMVLQIAQIKSMQQLNLDTLNSGVYFYKIESDTISQSGKIIKK